MHTKTYPAPGLGGWMGIGRKKEIRMGGKGGICLLLAMGLGVCNFSALKF